MVSTFKSKAHAQLLAFIDMKNKSSQILKLRSSDDAALTNTPQVQQALAQLEANLSREENQKVTEKSHKR